VQKLVIKAADGKLQMYIESTLLRKYGILMSDPMIWNRPACECQIISISEIFMWEQKKK
jgi:hypothetical protein